MVARSTRHPVEGGERGAFDRFASLSKGLGRAAKREVDVLREDERRADPEA